MFFYWDRISDVEEVPLVKNGESVPASAVGRTKQTTGLKPLIPDDELPEAVPLVPTADRVTAV